MNVYENFKNALKETKEKNYILLKQEIKKIETGIENFLEKALECSATRAENDFSISPL